MELVSGDATGHDAEMPHLGQRQVREEVRLGAQGSGGALKIPYPALPLIQIAVRQSG